MRVRQHALVLCLSLLAVLAAQPALAARPLEELAWLEVRSANFTVRSRLGKKDSVELSRYLELLHAAVPLLTNLRRRDAPIRTEIYVLRGNDFASLGIDKKNIAGLFLPGLRQNTILVRDTGGMQETSIVQHEYVHFLLRNENGLQYPRWFDEGIAEYMSATRVARGKFQIGRVPTHREDNLKYSAWIAARKILSGDSYDKLSAEGKSMYYAESWALVHFLLSRQRDGHEFIGPFTDYLGRLDAGEESVAAFEAAFDMTARELNRALKNYLSRGRFMMFSIDVEELLPSFAPDVVTLSREQAALGLADLALHRGELELAEDWYSKASLDPALRAWAEAGLGDVWKFRGEMEKAYPHFARALELAPEDVECQLDMAEFWHDRTGTTSDPGLQAQYLERARQHYIQAWKLDDGKPEIFAMYGLTYVQEGRDYDKAVEMLEEAERLLPSSLDIRLMLAEAYLGARRHEHAAKAAKSVLSWSHSESPAAERAQRILDSTWALQP